MGLDGPQLLDITMIARSYISKLNKAPSFKVTGPVWFSLVRVEPDINRSFRLNVRFWVGFVLFGRVRTDQNRTLKPGQTGLSGFRLLCVREPNLDGY